MNIADIQKLSGQGPRQLALSGPAWAGGLNQMTSRDPLPHQPLYDFVNNAQREVMLEMAEETAAAGMILQQLKKWMRPLCRINMKGERL